VVLFPGVFLPLHIFEPRYRDLVADVLADDKRLGMVLLQPGWEADYDGRPSIFPVGCSGAIVHSERLDDGRYNIVLRGLERVRIVSEDHGRAYRRAVIEVLPDVPLNESQRHELSEHRSKLDAFVARLMLQAGTPPGPSVVHASSMPDAELVHALAQGAHLDALEKQALLQADTLSERARLLVDLLEMPRWPETGTGQVH
jgi:Lon protease-like protein